MFTGLIEEIGKLTTIEPIAGGKRLHITAGKIMDDVKTGDSIAVNGVCLTVTRIGNAGFWMDAVGETLKKSTLNSLNNSAAVNLERALRLSDRLGGHLVQGHVNGVGRITRIQSLGENFLLEIDIPLELEKYVISEASIAIDGVSLTIARLSGRKVTVSVIPHTWKNTILQFQRVGQSVNLEVDILAKYVEKLLKRDGTTSADKFSEDWFKNFGYE